MAATTRNTKRPLNRCTSCGKTWYPRGGNLSSRCPKCGSTKTKLAGLGIIGTLGSLFLMLALTGHPNNPNSAPAANPAESSVRSDNDVSSSSQLQSSAESRIEQSSLPQGASDGTAGKSQPPIASAVSTEQAGSAKLIAAKTQDTTTVTPDDRDAAPSVAGSDATFMHH